MRKVSEPGRPPETGHLKGGEAEDDAPHQRLERAFIEAVEEEPAEEDPGDRWREQPGHHPPLHPLSDEDHGEDVAEDEQRKEDAGRGSGPEHRGENHDVDHSQAGQTALRHSHAASREGQQRKRSGGELGKEAGVGHEGEPGERRGAGREKGSREGEGEPGRAGGSLCRVTLPRPPAPKAPPSSLDFDLPRTIVEQFSYMIPEGTGLPEFPRAWFSNGPARSSPRHSKWRGCDGSRDA